MCWSVCKIGPEWSHWPRIMGICCNIMKLKNTFKDFEDGEFKAGCLGLFFFFFFSAYSIHTIKERKKDTQHYIFVSYNFCDYTVRYCIISSSKQDLDTAHWNSTSPHFPLDGTHVLWSGTRTQSRHMELSLLRSCVSSHAIIDFILAYFFSFSSAYNMNN